MKENKRFRRISIVLISVWLVLFALLPHLMLVLAAFLQRDPNNFVAPVFSLDAFTALFDPVFAKIFFESFELATVTTLLCLAMGYPFAYILNKAKKHVRPWLLLLLVIPFWTNSLIRTYAVMIILKANGLISKIVVALGFSDTPISLLYSDFAVIIGFSYTFLPFMILPIYASIEKMDMRLIDAAKDLGASSRQAFWRITVPLTLPGIVAGAMLVFLPALGAFYVPEILGGSKKMLLGSFIKNQFLIARDWPLGASASIAMTVVLALLIVVYCKVKARNSNSDDDELTEAV